MIKGRCGSARLEHVTRESQAAAQLPDLCAYLAPERIPLDLFTGHIDLLPEPLATAAGDELAFDEAIAVLVDNSLLKPGWVRPCRWPNGP